MVDITSSEVEIPRHFMEPLFILTNEFLQKSMEFENLYSLEILIDVLWLMNARNHPAEEKYHRLAEEAQKIAENLMRAINTDISSGSDDHLLQLLV